MRTTSYSSRLLHLAITFLAINFFLAVASARGWGAVNSAQSASRLDFRG